MGPAADPGADPVVGGEAVRLPLPEAPSLEGPFLPFPSLLLPTTTTTAVTEEEEEEEEGLDLFPFPCRRGMPRRPSRLVHETLKTVGPSPLIDCKRTSDA